MSSTFSTLTRKSVDLLKQIPRTARLLISSKMDYEASPPVLVNSFPKSGTHLLSQIIQALPGLTSFGAFLASMPSISFRERSVNNHLRAISRFVPGEIVLAHLFYHPDFEVALTQKNCLHFFIYRDPRDVAISEAYYLTHMNRWHRMHEIFAGLEGGIEESISLAIKGVSDPNFPYDYPNIAERFKRYKPWLRKENTFIVQYEQLTSSERQRVMALIARHYLDSVEIDLDIDALVLRMNNNIAPESSHTFRKGGSGSWRDEFTPEHIQLMKTYAGDLLVELGYEQDLDW